MVLSIQLQNTLAASRISGRFWIYSLAAQLPKIRAMLGFIPRRHAKLIVTNDQLTDTKKALQHENELRCN